MSTEDIWTYRVESSLGVSTADTVDLAGFSVEAVDGSSIGKIDRVTYDVGSSYIVVDTGPWIFGKKVVLPAGVIDRVDTNAKTVYVHRTKDEIKASPRFGEEDITRDDTYREELSGYYGTGGPGYRPW